MRQTSLLRVVDQTPSPRLITWSRRTSPPTLLEFVKHGKAMIRAEKESRDADAEVGPRGIDAKAILAANRRGVALSNQTQTAPSDLARRRV